MGSSRVSWVRAAVLGLALGAAIAACARGNQLAGAGGGGTGAQVSVGGGGDGGFDAQEEPGATDAQSTPDGVADGSPPGDAPSGCTAGQILCGSACVDPASDPSHCGGCNTVCPSGICGVTLAADMTQQPPNWTFNGVAVWDPAGPSARLTTAMTYLVAGTVVYNHPIVTDAFDVSFQFRIGANGGGRFDGMGFMIVVDGPTALGSNGGGLGMEGLDGFGVELDIYNNGQCGDSNGDHVGIDRLNNCGSGLPTSLFASPDLTGTVDLGDAQWHTATVHLAASAISVTVDAHAVATGVALTGFAPGTSYYLSLIHI